MSNLPEFQSGQKLTASDLNELVDAINSNTIAANRSIPANTSELFNDANFLTEKTLPSLKTINGESIIGSGNLTVVGGEGGYTISRPKDGNYNIIGIAHRGYSDMAPENTLPAFILAKQKGFNFVECDVAFTGDGKAVLLHNATIDDTSDGSGNISELTYEELLKYDFGSWKSNTYAGTKIPTFEEFINLCKKIGLHPYIEFKDNGSTDAQIEEQVKNVISLVKSAGMSGNVTYISFNPNYLTKIKTQDKTARLGYVVNSCTGDAISQVLALQTGANEVILDLKAANCNDNAVNSCKFQGIPLEVWTVDVEQQIIGLPAYVSGVTSNKLIAGKVIANSYGIYVNNNSGNGEAGGNTGGGDAGGSTDEPTDANFEEFKVINGNTITDYGHADSDPRQNICVGWGLNDAYGSGGKSAFAQGNKPARASYSAFDIEASPEYYYKARIEDINGNTLNYQIAYVWFTENSLSLVANNQGIWNTKLDSGWQDPSLPYRAAATSVKDSPLVGFRITMRVDDADSAFVDATDHSKILNAPPYKVVLYRAKAIE